MLKKYGDLCLILTRANNLPFVNEALILTASKYPADNSKALKKSITAVLEIQNKRNHNTRGKYLPSKSTLLS